jgi:ABC-type glycerol-3-phosphate transport system permease component
VPKLTRTLTTKGPLHLALVAGSVLFAFPFVWLVTTTFKGDEEIFSERLNWVPKIPWYSPTSPYIDRRAYKPMRRPASMSREAWERLEPQLRVALWERATGLAAEAKVSLPAEAREQVTRGLWEQVRDTLPPETLARDAQTVAQEAAKAVSEEALTTVRNRAEKQAAIGKLRLLDAANRDALAGQGELPWSVTRGSLAVGATEIDGESGRMLSYRDSRNGVSLEAQPPVTGDIERIALGLHDDESWRHVDLLLLTPKGAFRSKHPFVMGNGEWQDVTWTFTPPRDRQSLEIVLAPTSVPEPLPTGKWVLKVSLSRTSPLRATFDKFARNYREAIRYVPFWTFARNSVILVVLNILGQLFACSLVAYAFARLRWPGRDVIFVLLLSTMMLPPQVTMVPVFLIVRQLGLYNTLTPLWLPSFFGSAFFIFLLRQFLMTIPRDLEDAAKIDGCSYFGLYWRVMLPLIRPALAAVAIFQFLGSWNDFMGPLIYISDLRLTPLSLGLFQFQQEHVAEWGMLMAGSLLMTLPAILIFFLAQKHFIQGITLTGIK